MLRIQFASYLWCQGRVPDNGYLHHRSLFVSCMAAFSGVENVPDARPAVEIVGRLAVVSIPRGERFLLVFGLIGAD